MSPSPRHRRPSPALVVAILALIMSMAGTATAARVLISSSSQIKSGAVNGGDIRDGSVKSRDLGRNAVTGDKVRSGSIELGDLERGAREALAANTETQALEAFRKEGPKAADPNKLARVATLANVPSGTYAIFAKTVITPERSTEGLFKEGESVAAHCVLGAEGDRDESRSLLATPGSRSPGELTLQITRTFSGAGTVTLDCEATETKWTATDTSVIALRVGRAPRTSVQG